MVYGRYLDGRPLGNLCVKDISSFLNKCDFFLRGITNLKPVECLLFFWLVITSVQYPTDIELISDQVNPILCPSVFPNSLMVNTHTCPSFLSF